MKESKTRAGLNILAGLMVIAGIIGLSSSLVSACAGSKPEHTEIKQIAGGSLGSLEAVKANPKSNYGTGIALTADGQVYTWGQDYNGTLGNSGEANCAGDNDNDCYTSEPQDITDKLDGEVVGIDSVDTGDFGIDMLAYIKDGDVYAWGAGSQSEGLWADSPRDSAFVTPAKVSFDRESKYLGRNKFSDSAYFFYGPHSIYDPTNPDKGTEHHDLSSELEPGESIIDAEGSLLLTNRKNVYRIANLDNTEMKLSRVATNVKVKELISSNQALTDDDKIAILGGTGSAEILNTTSAYAATAKTIPGVNGIIGVTSKGEMKLISVRDDGGTDESTLFEAKVNTAVRPVLFTTSDKIGLTYVLADSDDGEAKVCSRELETSSGAKASDTENCVRINLGRGTKNADCGATKESPYERIHRFVLMQNVAIVGVIIVAVIAVIVLTMVLVKKHKK